MFASRCAFARPAGIRERDEARFRDTL